MSTHLPDELAKNYGFVIDNRKCIGCHACSTACKSENEVPLSVNRTWVKYVETGLYPDTRRHFQVTRCNHCANPPCVRICPTEAMYQRTDGIVEFDSAVCIGCKACMQACPYDAIYIDPDSHTAAKCHYCAHRTDIGLEPACVVVCPEHAIISGDMNNPASEISHLLATQKVTVRKPEQGTAPKVFYIDGTSVTLQPTAVAHKPETFLWADVIPLEVPIFVSPPAQREPSPTGLRQERFASSVTAIREPQTQGVPWAGPIQMGNSMAEHMVQTAYNAQHQIPWHWPVPAYLVTKGIASGMVLLLAAGLTFNWFQLDSLTAVLSGFCVLLFTAATTALLVYDLERPERFLYILWRPQWKSWLARGAIGLIGFTAVIGLWWLTEFIAATTSWISLETLNNFSRPLLIFPGFPLALLVAVYTAFLFAQAEGRDLWQSPLLPFHLVVQALLAGSSLFLLMGGLAHFDPALMSIMRTTAVTALFLDLFLIFFGEFGVPHASEIAARAAHEIWHGRYRQLFWVGSLAVGHALPLFLLLFHSAFTAALAALLSLAGLYFYEYAFIMAPQEIPNS